VAIVDDDQSVRRAMKRLVESLNLQASAFSSGSELLNDTALSDIHCALVDLHMPGLSGLDVIGSLRGSHIEIPVIIVTGFDQPGRAEHCLRGGAAAYLVKPIDYEKIAGALRAVGLDFQ
jgi:FixJ family two-component response regulator